MANLNHSELMGMDGTGRLLADPLVRAGPVTAHFRDLEAHLIGYITATDCVVGCVAWLTNENILSALARTKGVCVLVQKESFLKNVDFRPWSDADGPSWQRLMRFLPTLSYPLSYPGLIPEPGHAFGWGLDAVRCVGVSSGSSGHALLHHKFLVFCRRTLRIPAEESVARRPVYDLVPYAVWTGSYNLTRTATQSLENALYVADADVAGAYFREWEQLVLLSEPLYGHGATMRPEWPDTVGEAWQGVAQGWIAGAAERSGAVAPDEEAHGVAPALPLLDEEEVEAVCAASDADLYDAEGER